MTDGLRGFVEAALMVTAVAVIVTIPVGYVLGRLAMAGPPHWVIRLRKRFGVR